MMKCAPKVVALLLAGYLVSSPLVVMAKSPVTALPINSVTELPIATDIQIVSPTTETKTQLNKDVPRQPSKVRGTKENRVAKKARTSKKWAHSRTVKRSAKVTALGNQADCDACHDQCLVASLTCIALSIATGCLVCGPICVAGQLACQTICNGTSACQNLNQ
jgi:hypothetical protein